MHSGNEQVIAVDVDSPEHLPLPKRTDSGQEIEYGLDEVRVRGHGDDAQRKVEGRAVFGASLSNAMLVFVTTHFPVGLIKVGA